LKPCQHRELRKIFSAKKKKAGSLDSLVVRLCQKVGQEHVFLASPAASYKPESSWHKTLNEKDYEKGVGDIQTPYPQRPLRILEVQNLSLSS